MQKYSKKIKIKFTMSIFVLGSSKIKILDVALSFAIRLWGRVLDDGD
jgi:hypothetical protein